MSTIYVLRDDGGVVEMSEQPYDSATALQELLADYPHLLAGDQINDVVPRRWLLITRDAATRIGEGSDLWTLHHLFLDQDAIPTLVVVTHSNDTQMRREVVGLMLDYAAHAAAYWPGVESRVLFNNTCTNLGIEPDQKLADLLGVDTDTDQYWQQVETNLHTGKVRLIFVANEIPAGLRRVVEFLHAQMHPAEVLAMEIKQYVGEDFRTLVPKVIGQSTRSTEAAEAVSQPELLVDEKAFFQELEACRGMDDVYVARALLEWGYARGTRVSWDRGNTLAAFIPTINHRGVEHQLFAVWTTGGVEIYFYWYQYKPPFDTPTKRLEALQRLNAINGVYLPEDAISRRPTIPLSALRDDTALKQFLATFDWFIQEIQDW